eukprot:m.1133128 g.1133128  ORF g.1133128 m.1133128 type:complete len:332 (+) comp24427_c1_seq10:264-1259(+)
MAFQWIGKQINWVVWKRVLAEHPGLLPLFDPGQEAVLEKACEDHPKLRDAVKRFGPPPKALLDEIHNGTTGGSALQSWRRGGRLPPINRAQALSKEQMQGFFADGYVHLKGVIPTALVHRALQHINACFGRGMVDRSVPMLTGLPPAEASSPHIMDLFLDPTSALSTACQSLLGQGNVRVPHGAQVAVRFPLPPLADVAGSAKGPGGKAWHVDGFGQNQHSPFTLLVGVCLSPTPRPLMGNFAVHPGAHWTLQDAVRRHVSEVQLRSEEARLMTCTRRDVALHSSCHKYTMFIGRRSSRAHDSTCTQISMVTLSVSIWLGPLDCRKVHPPN